MIHAFACADTEALFVSRTITADAALRLCRFFGLSDGRWLRLQAGCDTEVAKATLAKALARIEPWKETAHHDGRCALSRDAGAG